MNWKLLWIRLSIVLFLLVGWSFEATAQAQDQPEKSELERIAEEIKALDSYDEMRTHFRQRMSAYSKKYRAAGDEKEKKAVVETRPDSTEYMEVLTKFLSKATPSEAKKITSWWWHGDRGKKDGEMIVDILLEHHLDTEMLVNFVPRFRRVLSKEKAEAAYRTLIKENNFDSVKASSMYSLQSLLAEKAKRLKGKEAEAVEAEVKTLCDSLKGEFGKMTDLAGITFAKRIEGTTFARNLKIGNPVPDIVGTDLEGVDFKLSDYKGKVIVLDFWGHW